MQRWQSISQSKMTGTRPAGRKTCSGVFFINYRMPGNELIQPFREKAKPLLPRHVEAGIRLQGNFQFINMQLVSYFHTRVARVLHCFFNYFKLFSL